MTARRVSAVPSRAPSAARGGIPVFITPVSRMGHCHHVSYNGTLHPTVSLGWSWRCGSRRCVARWPWMGWGTTLMHEHVFVLTPDVMQNYEHEWWWDEQDR